MKLSVNTDLLCASINKVLSVVDKKSSRPILSYTLFNVDKGTLEIKSTDLEVSVKLLLPVQNDESFSFCINAKNLFEILKELPNEELTMEFKQNSNLLDLRCGKVNFSLIVVNNEEFPNLNFTTSLNSFLIPSSLLLEVIHKTFYAVSNDETRIYLNGLFFQSVDNQLRTIATDGHRLALLNTGLNVNSIDSLINGIIIPKKGVNELKKLAESNLDATISLSVDDSFLYAKLEDSYYISIRLIARDYVKYQAVIPSKTTYTLKAEKQVILNALKRIKIMSNEKSNGIRLKLLKNQIEISANHPMLGNASESIEVEYEGKEMEIGFNAKYLIENLSVLDDGDVLIELNNELSPAVVKSSEDPKILGIVMPLKL